MGHGASCTRVETFDESVQMPSISPTTRSSSSLSFPIPSKSIPPKPIPGRKTPIPVVSEEDEFEVKTNSEKYSAIWDFNTKLSSAFQKMLKAEFDKAEHHQKETIEMNWAKKSSSDFGSAHVESSLSTETHSCINLSTSERIDELIKSLNRIHTQLDETIRRRTQQISVETESVLAHIINETQDEQQRLLLFAKQRQTLQNEHYREQLQAYIAKLDEIRAKEIARLQDELQTCREQILRVSQVKIVNVNEQANIAKSKVVKEEQQQASMKIEAINVQLQHLTTDRTFQQLGTESTSRTSVTASNRFGSKAPGQTCSFEFVQEIPNEPETKTEPSKTPYTTTTTYADVRSER